MKRFQTLKLALIAALMGFGSANAFAGVNFAENAVVGTGQSATSKVKFKVIATATNVTAANVYVAGLSSDYANETSITIPATFTEDYGGTKVTFTVTQIGKTDGSEGFDGTNANDAKITSISLPETVTTICKNALKGTKLTSIAIPANVTTIGASAFEGVTTLTSLSIPAESKLTTIGDNALGRTGLTTIDLKNATKLAFGDANVPFLDKSKGTNVIVKTVNLPVEITDINIALANLTALTTTNLAQTAVTEIKTNAFANDAALTSLVFPKTLTSVAGTPFDGCTNLASLYFDGEKLTTLGTASIDLYKSTVALQKIEIAKGKDFTGTIAAGAFTLKGDATITIGNIKGAAAIGAAAFTIKNETGKAAITIGNILEDATGTIAAGAFVLDNSEKGNGSSVTITNIAKAVFAANAITGITTKESAATLTIGNVSAALTTAILSGNISKATVGKITAALQLDVLGAAAQELEIGEIATGGKLTAYGSANETLEKVTFTGNVADEGAIVGFSGCTALATIDFGSIAMKAGAVAAKAFQGVKGTKDERTSVTWTPATATAAFDIAAFGNEKLTDANNATVSLETTEAVKALYGNSQDNLYNVYMIPAAVTLDVDLAGNGDGNIYGWFYVGAGDKYSIDKTNDLTLYTAYVDTYNENKSAAIYYNPLKVIGNKYYIKGATTTGSVVIVKQKSAETTGSITMTASSVDKDGNQNQTDNALEMTDKAYTYVDIVYGIEPHGKKLNITTNDVYCPLKRETKGLTFAKYDIAGKELSLKEGQLYIQITKGAALSKVVWLDEAGNTTAIEEVKSAASNDNVIYNLQGMKIATPKKGQIYIQNGKKMMMK